MQTGNSPALALAPTAQELKPTAFWIKLYAAVLGLSLIGAIGLVVMNATAAAHEVAGGFHVNQLAGAIAPVLVVLVAIFIIERRYTLSFVLPLLVLVALASALVPLLLAHRLFHGAEGRGFPLALSLGVVGFVPTLVLLFIERRHPAGPLPDFRKYTLNYRISILFGFLSGPLTGAVLGVSVGFLSRSLNLGLIDLGRWVAHWHIAGIVAAYVVYELTSDFFYYWFHRFQHESFLWHQHKLHHLDPQMNVTTQVRNHWLEGLLYIPIRLIPLALLLKFDDAGSWGVVGALVGSSLGFVQVLNHANIRLGFGRMAWLLTSPQLHRVHHSRLPQHYDKNYASVFPIWDVLFGTYYCPQRDEYPSTGVQGENDVEGVWDAFLLPFRAWRKLLRERPGQRLLMDWF